MKRALAALLYLKTAAVALAASVPRGVGPEFTQFYKDPNTFACISHPSITIPFSRVNDDYCDCPDGSDEPGTSACAHLSSLSPHMLAESSVVNFSLALPGFYCHNKGHIPSYLPFTSVNDGVCDHSLCCDGSEEWDAVGGLKCKDRCDEIGKEWRKLDAVRQKSANAAAKKRAELVVEASRLRQEVTIRIKDVGVEIEAAELKVKSLEQEVAEAQRNDISQRVSVTSSERKTKTAEFLQAAKKRMDDLREMLSLVQVERDSLRIQRDELEGILKTFKEEYNPNFNDEGVKRAVRAWEDFVANKSPFGEDHSQDDTLNQLLEPDHKSGVDWTEFESLQSDGDQDVSYSLGFLPSSLRNFISEKLRDLKLKLVEGGILAHSADSGTESPRLRDARGRLDQAKKDLEGHRTTLRDSESDLQKDYGPDDVFRAMQGKCVSTDSGEYTYELCFLDGTKQKPKKGGSDTNMGKFQRIERIQVDEELPANGKGLGKGERIVLRYENGQHCWNGPNRSTSVILACSEENEIWKIQEEEKCVYRMEVGTPAVCTAAIQSDADNGAKRDEL